VEPPLTPRPIPQSARTRFSLGVFWDVARWRRESRLVKRRIMLLCLSVAILEVRLRSRQAVLMDEQEQLLVERARFLL
jgi:hypothetical protein